MNESREKCLQVLRNRNLDTDVPHGDVGGERRTEQLNPAEEQGMSDDDQEEEEEQEQARSGVAHGDAAMGRRRKRSTSAEAIGEGRTDGLGPDVAAEEEKADEGGEEEGEEGREAVAAPAPRSPSRMERENHELTHTPYRAWCPHCVWMRGRNTAHKKQEKKETLWIPHISFD